MSTSTSKTTRKCRQQLSESETNDLARLIIQEASGNADTLTPPERMLPPSDLLSVIF